MTGSSNHVSFGAVGGGRRCGTEHGFAASTVIADMVVEGARSFV